LTNPVLFLAWPPDAGMKMPRHDDLSVDSLAEQWDLGAHGARPSRQTSARSHGTARALVSSLTRST
jgi:hypothetical protein